MPTKELFESIGFVYTGEAFGINFSAPCYKMKRGIYEITVCESLNQVGFDFLFSRMVQTINITYYFFKDR